MRRSAGRMARTSERRGRREAVTAARAHDAESPLDTMARAEAHERVVRAVMSLEEPYRTSIVLRFFDDLPPREVARRTNAPVETARARIRRGLEQVRARLDQEHGGDGATWRAALMPLAISKKSGGVGFGAGLAKGATLMGTATSIAAGAALAAGVLIGWAVGTRRADGAVDEARKQSESSRAEVLRASERAAALQTRLDEGVARERALEKRVRELGQTSEQLQKSLDAATAAAATTPHPAAATAAKDPRFAFPQFAVIENLNWKVIGKSVAEILPAAADLAEAAKRHDEKAVADARGKLMGPYMKFMSMIDPLEGSAPGTAPSGAFTGPACLLNAIAATLDAFGLPLSAEQTAAMERIGRASEAEDARRLAGYSESVFQLRREIDEIELRRRLVAAARGALSDAQCKALWPESVRDLGGLDLLSDNLLLQDLCRTVTGRTKAELADRMTKLVVNKLELGEARRDATRRVVEAWIEDLPPAFLDPKAGADELLVPAPVKIEGMRQTLALYDRLVRDLPLDAQATTPVRDALGGYVPLLAAEGR
jgi:hypothetical protein